MGLMAQVNFKGNPVSTVGEFPAVGAELPDFTIVGTDLQEKSKADFAGKKLVITFFPSIDTSVCAASVRAFNEKAAAADNTVVLAISEDLPFAHSRFCAAEGIENVVTGSAFRTTVGKDFGLTMEDGPLQGLLARAVLVTDADHKVVHSELVSEVTTEPDYDAAIAALA